MSQGIEGENVVTAKAIIGLMINDSTTLQCLAFRHREEPWLNQTDDRVGFSVGHYSGGETLLNIQPTGSPRDLLLSDVFPKQGAQLLLAQAVLYPEATNVFSFLTSPFLKSS